MVNGGPSPKIGEYHLEAARLWDEIISAAEANGVYIQLVLQHHGQYRSRVNPNWNENPFNKANGLLALQTPPVTTDVAAWIQRAE